MIPLVRHSLGPVLLFTDRWGTSIPGPTAASRTQGSVPALDNSVDMFNYFDMKPEYSQSLPNAVKPLSRVFSALGDEHRQRILLLFEPGERLNVGQIAEVATLTRPTVSHHLKILRQAGVLESEKIGKEVWFWINKPYLEQVLGDVLDYVRRAT